VEHSAEIDTLSRTDRASSSRPWPNANTCSQVEIESAFCAIDSPPGEVGDTLLGSSLTSERWESGI